jgi:hypothetical protein
MFRNLGTLTVVVMLSFLVGLGLSRGILAAVLKAMSCRSFSFTGRKARLVSSSQNSVEFSSLNHTGGTAQRAKSDGEGSWQKALNRNSVPQRKR